MDKWKQRCLFKERSEGLTFIHWLEMKHIHDTRIMYSDGHLFKERKKTLYWGSGLIARKTHQIH